MDSLVHMLAMRSADELALMTSRTVKRVSALLASVEALRRGEFVPLRNQKVTVCCGDIADYIGALLALDGWVSRMLVVDDGIQIERLDNFERTLGIAHRVTVRDGTPTIEHVGTADAPKEGHTQWVIPTSGTTGEPKLIAHDFPSLTRTVKAPTASSAELRWGLLYSPTRFAGLQVVLQALGGGSALVVPDDPADLEVAIPMMESHGCNALSATPSLWRKLAFTELLGTLSLKVVTLGGEAADQKILDTLRMHFPDATIRHIYASTEAGVGFSVSDGLAGFPISYLEHPPPGVELRLEQDGMLMLRATQGERMLSRDPSLINDEGWILSGDLVELREGRYHFLGRKSGAINVGGQKVHPTGVEEVLQEVPGVVAARVYGKPNPILGAVVVAEIVREAGADPGLLRKHLANHCRTRLERFQAPALFSFVEAFELTATGKVKR